MTDTNTLDHERFTDGANEDTRPEEQKQKDFSFTEMVAAANPVNFIEKSIATLRKFPIANQNGSGSCVAQTLALLLGIMAWLKLGKFIRFSATHIYQRRSNKPQSGMIGVEAFDIVRKGGATLDEFVGSDMMTDAQMDGMPVLQVYVKVGEEFKIANFVVLPARNFDVAASTMQTTGKPIMMWFHFLYSEWDIVPHLAVADLPERPTDAYPGVCRHSVAGIDTTLIGPSNLPGQPNVHGKQAIFMQDSWGAATALDGRRFITREFYEKRNLFAAYPINFQFEDQTQNDQPVKPDPNKPRYKFTKPLVFIPLDKKGNISDQVKYKAEFADVQALQKILMYEGTFPKNVSATGYYGSITVDAVTKYKKKYALADKNGYDGKTVDANMIEHLNQRYS